MASSMTAPSGNSIGALSRLALHETIGEMTSGARQAAAASSAAWRWLRTGVEQRLGIEVSVDDPALRGLFGHLVEVESQLIQVRTQALALSEGARIFAEGAYTLGSVAFSAASGGDETGRGATAAAEILEGLDQLARTTSRGQEEVPSASRAVGPTSGDEELVATALTSEGLAQTVWRTWSLSPNAGDSGSARYRMERLLVEQVLRPIEERLQFHERIREKLREREKWRQELDESIHDVEELHKSRRSLGALAAELRSGGASVAQGAMSGGLGLRTLMAETPASRVATAEERMVASQKRVSTITEQVLDELLEARQGARVVVAKPWAALARIRAEFFASLAGHWGPVATDLLPLAFPENATRGWDGEGGKPPPSPTGSDHAGAEDEQEECATPRKVYTHSWQEGEEECATPRKAYTGPEKGGETAPAVMSLSPSVASREPIQLQSPPGLAARRKAMQAEALKAAAAAELEVAEAAAAMEATASLASAAPTAAEQAGDRRESAVVTPLAEDAEEDGGYQSAASDDAREGNEATGDPVGDNAVSPSGKTKAARPASLPEEPGVVCPEEGRAGNVPEASRLTTAVGEPSAPTSERRDPGSETAAGQQLGRVIESRRVGTVIVHLHGREDDQLALKLGFPDGPDEWYTRDKVELLPPGDNGNGGEAEMEDDL